MGRLMLNMKQRTEPLVETAGFDLEESKTLIVPINSLEE